jgi:hypothetical protein
MSLPLAVVRFRDLGPHARAIADVARTDPAPAVRSAAIALLGDRLATLPTLRPVLDEIRARDAEARNRELAARYLDRPDQRERTAPRSR